MALDEPQNWSHAAALDAGENPDKAKRRAHEQRIEALASLMGEHEHDLSDHFFRKMAGRLVAYAPRVVELLQPPAPTIHRDLSQSRANEVDSIEWWTEHAGHLKREYDDALAILGRIRAGRMAEYDPDAVAEAAEDRRLAEQRHDQHAAENAPTGIAS